MKYTTKNPLINQMVLTQVNYDKFIPIVTSIVNKSQGTDLTEEEVKKCIDYLFNDFIDWIYNPVTTSSYAITYFMTTHVNFFSVCRRIEGLVKKLREAYQKDEEKPTAYSKVQINVLKKKIRTL